MKSKTLYIVDIRFKQKNIDLSEYITASDRKILSLTPYSSYLLNQKRLQYITFDEIQSNQKYKENVLNEYQKLENLFDKNMEFGFILRDLAHIKTYEIFIDTLSQFFQKYEKDYHIVYITDLRTCNDKKYQIDINTCHTKPKIDKYIHTENKDTGFYRINIYRQILHKLLYKKHIFKKIISKYISKNTKTADCNYDNSFFCHLYNKLKPYKISGGYQKSYSHIEAIEKYANTYKGTFCYDGYMHIVQKLKNSLLLFDRKNHIHLYPFTFLSGYENYSRNFIYKTNKIKRVFMQHGSYLHENYFLRENEISPSDINFVFNNYTKDIFLKRGAKKVFSVGSIYFNYKVKERKKRYDFLYIAYCTQYSHTATYINCKENRVSADANNLYVRHKQIIELFGTKFKDKSICIKVQPGIMTSTMLYIPLLELSKPFKNITIEFSVSIEKIVSHSRYIISDYFSSEFINRELHYKRDIILFKNFPLKLPSEVLEDMEKMFILADSVDDLEKKIENIDKITKNRKRYDAIIEHYSSKRCDTKKDVMDILKRELNGR